MEDFLLGDGRFVQNNFLQPISIENLYDSHLQENMSPEEKDTLWFVGYGNRMYDEENLELGEEMVDEDEVEGYADSEFEDEESEHDHKHHGSFQQHQHALQQQRQQLVSNDTFYNIMLNPDPLGMGETQEAERKSPIEGNLGDRMDTNITHITLDTNIWLKHCGRIFKCVRNLVFKILIPLIVFQAVSYTHLDVYKRQGSRGVSRYRDLLRPATPLRRQIVSYFSLHYSLPTLFHLSLQSCPLQARGFCLTHSHLALTKRRRLQIQISNQIISNRYLFFSVLHFRVSFSLCSCLSYRASPGSRHEHPALWQLQF